MTNAVVDAPETTAPETQPDEATTRTDEEIISSDGTERDGQPGSDSETIETPDPEAVARQAEIEAKAADLADQREAERKATKEREDRDAEERQRASRIQNWLSEPLPKTRAFLTNLRDDYGNAKLNATEVEQALGEIIGANNTLVADIKAAYHVPIVDAAKALITELAGEDEYKSFLKETADGVPMTDYLKGIAERIAPKAQSVATVLKNMSVEDYETASPKGKAVIAKRVADADKTGYNRGLEATAGGGPVRGENNTPAGGRYSTLADLTAAREAGQIPDNQKFLAEQNRLLGISG